MPDATAGMLAKDGRCKTLDAFGDGYVRAETCVTLLMETLVDGQQAAALLLGSAVNQVGLVCERDVHDIKKASLRAVKQNQRKPIVPQIL